MGTLKNPFGIAVDQSSGLLYIADQGNNRVVVMDMAEVVVRTFGSPGSGPGQLSYPHGITLDAQGNVLVADFGNSRVVVFKSDGTPLTHFAIPMKTPAFVMVDSGSGSVLVSGDRECQVCLW